MLGRSEAGVCAPLPITLVEAARALIIVRRELPSVPTVFTVFGFSFCSTNASLRPEQTHRRVDGLSTEPCGATPRRCTRCHSWQMARTIRIRAGFVFRRCLI